MNIEFHNPQGVELILNFSPIEQAILVDNILSNSAKAKSKNVTISVAETDRAYELMFTDDGEGLTNKYKPEELFSAGISTTRTGSGTGLSNVLDIVQRLEGNVEITNVKPKGARVRIWWGK